MAISWILQKVCLPQWLRSSVALYLKSVLLLFEIVIGKGDDPDARSTCFVMDTGDYPVYVAEQYHQFHDGFNWGENYPNDYNNLASRLAKADLLGQSQCPNGLIGIGALGL
jgi:hypothetical protein